MNPTNDNSLQTDEHLLDLLVDDELSEQRRRDLLASLDHTPDGWRRCALAFLEAQCLQRELGRISSSRPTEARLAKPPGGGAARGKQWQTLVAMAASFLLALGLGTYWQGWFVADRDVALPPIERNGSDEPADLVVPERLAEESSLAASDAAHDTKENSDSWRLVSFAVSDGADEVETVRIPAVERDSIDEVWRMNLTEVMPPEVARAIEDSGHRVRAQRRLLPLRMKDGRRLVVPVDQVELHYVGSPAYY